MRVPAVAGGSVPTFVTTARITQGRDNSSRLEVGLELPQNSADTDVAEGRGKFPVRPKVSKVPTCGLGGWSAIPCRVRDVSFRHYVQTGSVAYTAS
jgi:hypothetical protein